MNSSGVFRVKIMHKYKPKLCGFSIVPGGGPSLLGILDVETLELLSVNCITVELI